MSHRLFRPEANTRRWKESRVMARTESGTGKGHQGKEGRSCGGQEGDYNLQTAYMRAGSRRGPMRDENSRRKGGQNLIRNPLFLLFFRWGRRRGRIISAGGKAKNAKETGECQQ